MKLPRHAEIWLTPYIKDRVTRKVLSAPAPKRVWLMVADHWEPMWRNADLATAQRRVSTWLGQWPSIAARTKDSAGNAPKYSFFYPEEEYRHEFLEALAEMVRAGIADVEIHIHHDGEGKADFIRRISSFRNRLAQEHGLLRQQGGRTVFGFIHGNWALDNSRPDGRRCGLTGEIAILKELGCYADFTMPSGNSPTQARVLNQIYWCNRDADRPKSYDSGVPAKIACGLLPNLLMIPGPFGFRWRERMFPRMETGEIAVQDLPTRLRVRRWFDLAPRLDRDLFIKLYTHGAQEANSTALLRSGLNNLFGFVSEEAAARGAEVYFVSAWEMYLAIVALCQSVDPVLAVLSSHRDVSSQLLV